jgi:hypothetical protein
VSVASHGQRSQLVEVVEEQATTGEQGDDSMFFAFQNSLCPDT